MMPRARSLLSMVAAGALLFAACGDDDDPVVGGSSTTSTSSTSSTTTSTTTTAPAGPDLAAIWPAPGVRFATPEEAAKDFVATALDVTPVLGEFQPGDSSSGEMEVYSPGEDGSGSNIVRSRLLLRRLGEGWFVIGAVNENASISSPAAGSEVPAGPMTVSGVARGFEANVVVTAFVPGTASPPLDKQVTLGGAMADPEPFAVDLDLSSTSPGDVAVLLVRGGTGLEEDPGDFGAVPVVIAT